MGRQNRFYVAEKIQEVIIKGDPRKPACGLVSF